MANMRKLNVTHLDLPDSVRPTGDVIRSQERILDDKRVARLRVRRVVSTGSKEESAASHAEPVPPNDNLRFMITSVLG